MALTGWFTGWWAQPAYYSYGQNVYYEDNSVYYGDQAVATADEYYQQAETIADGAPEAPPADDAESAEWLPLGVFALTQPDSEASNMLLQLAVNKEGVIAGTYYNEATDATHPVEGMVDKKTQRAAWRFADGASPEMVMETGIFNLTKDQTTLLVHFGPEKTQDWMMVRLDEPEEDGSEKPATQP